MIVAALGNWSRGTYGKKRVDKTLNENLTSCLAVYQDCAPACTRYGKVRKELLGQSICKARKEGRMS